MEPRKNKRSSNNKQKPPHLTKGDSRSGKQTADGSSSQPRILLKSKEKDEVPKKTEPTITIATKAPPKATDQQQQQKESAPIRSRPTQETLQTVPAQVANMVKSVNLVSGHNTLNVHAFDYLQEGNSDFFVIGAIGMQGSGKSTLLNVLASDPTEDSLKTAVFHVGGGVFPVSSIFNQNEMGGLDEEIRMHITKDRIILLDSAPVLSNRGKKDFVLSELDDIRRIILLLSVCHVLIVLQEDYFNINFVRLLRCAEMMIQRDQKDNQFLNPRILFVKNKCTRTNFAKQEIQFHETIYKNLFKDSDLKIYPSKDVKEPINMINLPKLTCDNYLFTDEEDFFTCVQKFRKTVFMTPIEDTFEGPDVLTEKSWSQIIYHVLEGHNSNYFLRKYENLKEKYNLHNHVNVVENAAKDKSYLNFVET